MEVLDNDTIFRFILRERFITLTVIGSIFTFSFISSLKADIIDPMLDIVLPEDFFGYMNITLREGEKQQMPLRHVELRVGNFFKQFVTWIFTISVLFILAIYTKFPDEPLGNARGSAAM
jgi:large-conductance mechanosensitive channel